MVEQNLKDDKYIVFSMTQSKVGIDQIFKTLNVVFMEAFELGRVPVVGKFAVRSEYNFYCRRDDFQFEDYLNLSEGTIRPIDKVDSIVKDSQKWIREEDFDLDCYAVDKVLQVSDEVVSSEMSESYDVIVRRDPTAQYAKDYAKKKPAFLLDFPYSEKVNGLTDKVLKTMGTSRENALAGQYYFWDKVGTMRSCFDEQTRARGSSISLRDAYYACMQVTSKRGVRPKERPMLQFAFSNQQVKTLLSYAISKGSRLYIMSDIRNPNHFDFLKEDYRVYRYHDFPELAQLVSSEQGSAVDNVMLHLVEKNIMRHATVKIIPPRKGMMMYHLNEVYDLSLLKKPPKLPEEKQAAKDG